MRDASAGVASGTPIVLRSAREAEMRRVARTIDARTQWTRRGIALRVRSPRRGTSSSHVVPWRAARTATVATWRRAITDSAWARASTLALTTSGRRRV